MLIVLPLSATERNHLRNICLEDARNNNRPRWARYCPKSVYTRNMNLLACPKCKTPLSPGKGSLACDACGESFPVNDGIVSFARSSSNLGEFTRDEMLQFLEAAEDIGWREVLKEMIRPIRPAVFGLLTDPRRSNFTRLLGLVGGEAVLDFGCGFGGISVQLAKKCGTVVSLDSGLERLRFLYVIRKQDRIENIIPVHNADVLALPFADDCFDVVTLVGVFEYLPLDLDQYGVGDAQHRCLAEFHRVLKPGGQIFIGTKNRFGWPYLAGAADHNGLRFGPVLPRLMASLLSWMIFRRPYRIIVDSYSGYGRLLHGAGFGDLRFHWPIPGYQGPDGFQRLDGDTCAEETVAWRANFTGWREAALSLGQRVGLLKHFVPHFAIVARKQ